MVVEKIPQHKHCHQCGKAFIGKGDYCSTECTKEGEELLKKKKRQLLVLYAVTFIILIVALLVMAMP